MITMDKNFHTFSVLRKEQKPHLYTYNGSLHVTIEQIPKLQLFKLYNMTEQPGENKFSFHSTEIYKRLDYCNHTCTITCNKQI